MLSSLSLPCSRDDLLRGFRSIINTFRSLEISQQKNFSLTMANRMFVDTGANQILDSFRIQSSQFFRAEAENLDFDRVQQTMIRINDWVESQTNGKIK